MEQENQNRRQNSGRITLTEDERRTIQEMINEMLPGLTMYVRDLNLSTECLQAYHPGEIIMERGFTDASGRVRGMVTDHRITILSNHMADLSEFEKDTGWHLFVANHHAHFKVLDLYTYADKTQILLLHLPDDRRWKLFRKVKLSLEQQFIEDTRKRFAAKCLQEPVKELTTAGWLERCCTPIGMDTDGKLYDPDELPDPEIMSENMKSLECQILTRIILQGLTGDREKDADYLKKQMERYQDHYLGKPILKTCAAKLYELLPEEEKQQLSQASGTDQKQIQKRLNQIRRLIREQDYDTAKPLMDALVQETDQLPLYREDEQTRYFCFGEWFEETLYREKQEMTKQIRQAGYPYDEIYLLQSSFAVAMEDYETARTALQKAMEWNPVNADLAYEYAETFKLTGDLEQFLQETLKAQSVSFRPRHVARFLRNVGYYLIENGKYEDAMMCYARSILYDKTSKAAESEILYLHERYHVEIQMPGQEACREFQEQYGFSLSADNHILDRLYAYSQHFLESGEHAPARYCLQLLYDLTEDPSVKQVLEQLPE